MPFKQNNGVIIFNKPSASFFALFILRRFALHRIFEPFYFAPLYFTRPTFACAMLGSSYHILYNDYRKRTITARREQSTRPIALSPYRRSLYAHLIIYIVIRARL